MSKFLVIPLVITLVILVQSLWMRIIHVDDVWLGEYSYWLAKLGYVKSEAMRGFYNAETKLYVYHKLLAYQGAWVIDIFGFKPYYIKAISLIYTLASLPLLAIIYRKYSPSGTSVLLLITLFLSFFHTMNLAFTFRPEMHLAFWGLASFILIDRFLDSSRWLNLSLAGIISGIGIATHLNGVIFTGASVLFLWINRKWLAGFIYGTFATWGLLFYFFIDARSLEELRMSYTQLSNWRDVATGKYGWHLALRVFEEQGRYLHSPPEILYSLFLLLLLIPARKCLKGAYKRIATYTLLLSFLVAEIAHGTNTNYMMYAFPFLVLLAIGSFDYLWQMGRKKIALSAVGIFMVGSWGYSIEAFSHREHNAPRYKIIAEFLPKGANVLSPPYLMPSGLEKFRIQTFVSYRDKVEAGTLPRSAMSLFQEARLYDIEYVVFDKSNLEYFDVQDSSYGNYEILPEQPVADLKIYKRK